jgi:GntR family transcriptional regulator
MAREAKKRSDAESTEIFRGKEPKYLLLAKQIAQDIRHGRYAVGDLLPPEIQLAQSVGVGRHTVREAIRNLKEVGLVSVHHGIGTRIKAAEVKPQSVFAIGAIEDFLQYVAKTQLRITRRERMPAQLASVDLPDVGEQWFVMEGFRYRDSLRKPICWTRVFLNPAYKRVARTIGTSSEPLFVQVESQYGERVEEIEQQITAVSLTAEMAAMLQAKQAAPALSTLRRYLATEGRVIAVTVTIHPADRFLYQQKLQRDKKPISG